MTQATESTVTQLLYELQDGNRAALDRLYPLVYDELRVLAHGHRRRWHGDETLGTTALVHEAYLKLVGNEGIRTGSRAHFFAVAAKVMRHVLINYARARRQQKRGGDLQKLPLEALEALPNDAVLTDEQVETVAALDSALTRLEQTDNRLGQVVEFRFFGGMSIADTAAVLRVSPATVKRDWTLARAWLFRELQQHRDF